ncbi:MAG: MarR family winged helix-turn-helix transcriptional regulator [Inquilinaceae bacterium]
MTQPAGTADRPILDAVSLKQALRPENSAGFLLWQVTNGWQRQMRSALDPTGLTHVQYVLLAGLGWLETREKGVTQARLAQFCRTDAMMTSQVIRALEGAGLVTRTRHPDDNRARALALTDAGAKALNGAMKAAMDADRAFFDALGSDRAALVETLRRLWPAPRAGV